MAKSATKVVSGGAGPGTLGQRGTFTEGWIYPGKVITMFERFTERARQVVVLAQEEARSLKHNYIGTEHLLLGMLREEEGIAAQVLTTIDVNLD